MEVTSRWYIDAWAVYDGLAFASRSVPEIRRTERVTDAETTVFLSVPELEPIPLGRITTGLRAARASFQDGFFDEDGTEIAFDSLEAVRETVRRGYLTGGLGPGGAGLPERPAPAPPAPGVPAMFADGEAASGPPLNLAREILDGDPGLLREEIRSYAQAVVTAWEDLLGGEDPGSQAALAELYIELVSAGVWDDFSAQRLFAENHGLIVGTRYLDPHAPGLPLWRGRRYPAEYLAAAAPCPPLPLQRGFSRLSDPVKLSVCDSTYLRAGGLPRAVQVLTGGVLVGVTGEDVPAFWFGADRVLDDRLRAAIDWIEGQLPAGVVPEAADRLLNDLAWRTLEGPPPVSAPPPTTPAPMVPTG